MKIILVSIILTLSCFVNAKERTTEIPYALQEEVLKIPFSKKDAKVEEVSVTTTVSEDETLDVSRTAGKILSIIALGAFLLFVLACVVFAFFEFIEVVTWKGDRSCR